MMSKHQFDVPQPPLSWTSLGRGVVVAFRTRDRAMPELVLCGALVQSSWDLATSSPAVAACR